MSKAGRILLVAAVAVLVVYAPAKAVAAGGTYQVSACDAAPEAVNNSWTWETTDPSTPDHFAEHTNCPYRLGGDGGISDQEGGLSTTDALGLSNGAPPGTSAAWTFTAPAGTTIAGIEYERYIGHTIDPDNYWSPALRADGVIIAGETCLDSVANGESCFVGAPPGEGAAPGVVTGLSAHQLSLGIVCQAPSGQQCITGATEHAAWAAMYGATVTVSDPTPPTLGAPSGPLWEASAPGTYVKGSETVRVEAQDVGGGVQSIILAADGHPIDTYTAPCNYTFAQPCPLATGPQTLTLPSSQLTDGPHTLTIAAVDAAGNESVIASEQVTVANNPPPGPVGLTATAVQPGGSTFTASWSEPTVQGAPITAAVYEVCPSSGSAACSTPASAPADGPATVTVPGAGSWTLAVWLLNGAGEENPADAAHATLTVPTPSGGGGGGQGGGGSEGGGQGGGSGGGGGGGPGGGGSTSTKASVRVSEALHGRKLVVHVSGPSTGKVRVSIDGRLTGRLVFTAHRTVALRQGRLTVTFKLGPRTAAHATIRVSAKLGHSPTVVSTLHRPRHHRAKRKRKG